MCIVCKQAFVRGVPHRRRGWHSMRPTWESETQGGAPLKALVRFQQHLSHCTLLVTPFAEAAHSAHMQTRRLHPCLIHSITQHGSPDSMDTLTRGERARAAGKRLARTPYDALLRRGQRVGVGPRGSAPRYRARLETVSPPLRLQLTPGSGRLPTARRLTPSPSPRAVTRAPERPSTAGQAARSA
jgi:hypothetical protein